jgi:hypothetical protein
MTTPGDRDRVRRELLRRERIRRQRSLTVPPIVDGFPALMEALHPAPASPA